MSCARFLVAFIFVLLLVFLNVASTQQIEAQTKPKVPCTLQDEQSTEPSRRGITISGNKKIGTDSEETITSTDAQPCLMGKKGDDKLYGGPGMDILIGGAGSDKLYGGEADGSKDIYYCDGLGPGRDLIFDYDPGGRRGVPPLDEKTGPCEVK